MSASSAIPQPESAQQPLAKESESNIAVDEAVLSRKISNATVIAYDGQSLLMLS
jgi:hypothetical protein